MNIRRTPGGVKVIVRTDSYFLWTEIDGAALSAVGVSAKKKDNPNGSTVADSRRVVYLFRRWSLSPVHRYPGTGQDSNGRRKQDARRLSDDRQKVGEPDQQSDSW
jgi:hypothetical protein